MERRTGAPWAGRVLEASPKKASKKPLALSQPWSGSDPQGQWELLASDARDDGEEPASRWTVHVCSGGVS